MEKLLDAAEANYQVSSSKFVFLFFANSAFLRDLAVALGVPMTNEKWKMVFWSSQGVKLYVMVPTTSPFPGSFSRAKLAFLAALIAAARSCESPAEERHEITLPARFTRMVTVIAPPIPARWPWLDSRQRAR